MKGIKLGISLLLSISLIWSSLGMPVYAHYCLGRLMQVSVLEEPAGCHVSTKAHQHDHEKESGCHLAELERSCCDDKVFVSASVVYTTDSKHQKFDTGQTIVISHFNLPKHTWSYPVNPFISFTKPHTSTGPPIFIKVQSFRC